LYFFREKISLNRRLKKGKRKRKRESRKENKEKVNTSTSCTSSKKRFHQMEELRDSYCKMEQRETETER
jgi:hypothetical protein